MPDSMDPRRKRLEFRSRRMGTVENDILFGGFAERHLADLSEAQLARYEILLEENDIDLFNWVTGKEKVPEALDNDVMALLKGFRPDPFSG